MIDGVSEVAYDTDSHTGRRRQPGQAAWVLPRALKPARRASKHLYLLSVQPVLAIPARKRARHVHAFALALPLYQRRHRRPSTVWSLELVSEVFVVGGGGAEHRRMPGQRAFDLIVLNWRAWAVVLLFNGQRQARRAAEVRRGDNVLLLRGRGGVYRDGEGGVVGPAAGQLVARDCGHIDGPGVRRG